jgi:hypothetical protein
MNMSQNELLHEKHSRLAFELGTKILDEFPTVENRLSLLASIAKGVICLTAAERSKRKKLAETLLEAIHERLDEEVLSDGVESASGIEQWPIQMHSKAGDLVFRIAKNGHVELGPAYGGDGDSRKFIDQLALMIGEKFKQSEALGGEQKHG